jgi:hypothetical protein
MMACFKRSDGSGFVVPPSLFDSMAEAEAAMKAADVPADARQHLSARIFEEKLVPATE